MPYRNPDEAHRYQLDYYQTRKETIRKKKARYYRKYREKLREKHKKYYLEHRDEILTKLRRMKETMPSRWQQKLARDRRWYRENPVKMREYRWKRKGMRFQGGPMTQTVFDVLFSQQEGKCAICHRSMLPSKLHVDHDHTSQEVRGLACWRCNRLLISIHTPITAAAVLDYLNRPPAHRSWWVKHDH